MKVRLNLRLVEPGPSKSTSIPPLKVDTTYYLLESTSSTSPLSLIRILCTLEGQHWIKSCLDVRTLACHVASRRRRDIEESVLEPSKKQRTEIEGESPQFSWIQEFLSPSDFRSVKDPVLVESIKEI